jgi:hypothetical protein
MATLVKKLADPTTSEDLTLTLTITLTLTLTLTLLNKLHREMEHEGIGN